MIERDRVLDPILHSLELQSEEASAVRMKRDAECFDLHHPVRLGQSDVSLEIYVPSESIIQDLDGCQPRLHLEGGRGRRVLHGCSKESAEDSLWASHGVVEFHHLIRAEWDKFSYDDRDAIESDDFLQLIPDVISPLRSSELADPVSIR